MRGRDRTGMIRLSVRHRDPTLPLFGLLRACLVCLKSRGDPNNTKRVIAVGMMGKELLALPLESVQFAGPCLQELS
jgi:hypothetical protein